MPAPRTLRCYGDGHLALVSGDQPRVDLDPCLPQDDDARQDALGALDTGFLVLSHGGRNGLDDALDVLDAVPGSVLVASAALCDRAGDQLELEDRLVDVADWDRVRFAGLRLTALPPVRAGLPGAEVLPGADLLPDPQGILTQATDTLGRAVSGLPLVSSLAAQATGLGAVLGGGQRRAFALELDDGPTVLFAGDGLVGGGAPRRWLEDVAEAVDVDVLVASAGGDRVDGLVRAVRELEPSVVVLYRDHDPYDGRHSGLPMARYVEALQEDAPDVKVVHLRAGQELPLGTHPTEAP